MLKKKGKKVRLLFIFLAPTKKELHQPAGAEHTHSSSTAVLYIYMCVCIYVYRLSWLLMALLYSGSISQRVGFKRRRTCR
jgi:hypothetical protein